MKKKLLAFVPILITFIIILLFVYGINLYNNSFKKFLRDGYVIDIVTESKLYFAQDNKYKINKSLNNVEFKTVDKKEAKIEESSFIHYVDNSISVFKKAVVLDLDKIDGSVFQYYNFFPDTVFLKDNKDYKIAYLDKSINMKNFIIKISDNKYMVVGEKITISIGDETKEIEDGYFEINYIDGNIIRLDNQEMNLQNISANLIVNLDNNTSIDLIKKKIYFKDDEKINLGEITIDSSDNIDIVSDEDNELNPENISKSEKNENNSNGETSSKNINPYNGRESLINNGFRKFPAISDGIIEIDNDIIEEVVIDNAAIKDAEFTITSLDVTSNSIKAEIQITDSEKTLEGAKTIKIIKNNTNETVYYEQDNNGRSTIFIDVEDLAPETNYTLIVNSSYSKNDMSYEKDFIQKTFITLPLGIEITKNYAKTNELSFMVTKKEYSNVTRYSYRLIDKKDEIIEENTVSATENNVFTFKNLKSNSNYTLVLYDFVFENILVSGGEELIKSGMTLKQRPIIGNNSFSVDKQNSKFIIYLNNIKDIDSGIKSYYTEVYDKNELILEKNNNNNSNIEIPVDGEKILRNTDYRVYLYLLFNDNEKEYEIPVGSEEMNMNTTRRGPSISFDESKITWESIDGNILIRDEDSAIDLSRNVLVSYQNLSIGTGVVLEEKYNLTRINQEELILPIKINNLRANDSYLFTVKAYVDYDDQNGYVLVDIGQFIVQTSKPQDMTVEFVDIEDVSSAFNVSARLKSYVTTEDTNYEAQTMSEVTFRVYMRDYDKTQRCVSWNGCWEKTVYDENEEEYISTLKAEYYDKSFTINPEFMGMDENDISYGLYKIEVVNAKDYTDFKNDLPIIHEPKEINASSVSESIISKKNPLAIVPILNNGADAALYNKTVIGYELTPNILPSDAIIESIIFHIYDSATGTEIAAITKTPSNNSDLTENVYFSTIDGFERGKSYYILYDIKTNKSENYERSNESDRLNPLKQEPEFDLYLSKRENNSIFWKYYLTDVDNAIQDNSIYYSLGNNSLNYTKVKLNQTTMGQLNDFECLNITNGRLNVYRIIQLNETLEEVRINDAQVQIEALTTNFGDFDYEIVSGVNSITVNLGLNDTKALKVVSANITLTAPDGTTKTLKDIEVVNKKINIEYSKIRELISKGEISTEIVLFYDTGYYGPNNEENGNYAFQLSGGKYKIIENERIFEIKQFDFYNKKITVNNAPNQKTINFTSNKGYLTINTDDVSIKLLNQVTGTCQNNCTFSFDVITPSLELEDRIESYLTSIKLNPYITNIDSVNEDNMYVKLSVLKANNDICTSNIVQENNIPIASFKKGYTISNLNMNTDYCIYMQWYNNNNPSQLNNFYYPENNSYSKIYAVNTIDSIGIKNIDISYYPNNGRSLRLAYDVEVTEGYDGIRYEAYEVKNNTEILVEDISFSDDSVEIFNSTKRIEKLINIAYILKTKVQYNIRIIPYVINEEVRKDLDYVSVPFNFNISEPTVTVVRTSQSSDNKISFRVRVSDSSNSTYEKENYQVFIKNTDGTTLLLGTRQINKSSSYKNIECEGGVCKVLVTYYTDINNTNNYISKEYEKEFHLNENVLIDYPTVISSSNPNTITIAFSEFLNINAINTLQYTIIKNDAIIKTDTITPEFIINSDESNYAYLTINENLSAGEYTIDLMFSWNDSLGTQYKHLSVVYIKT